MKSMKLLLALAVVAAPFVARAFQYAHVAVVAESGGDYTSPVTALDVNQLPTWCPEPEASRKCLLKVMPGKYTLGTTSLAMRNNIDVEGSGEGVTILEGTGASVVVFGTAINAELRQIRIERNDSAFAEGVRIGPSPARLSHVTVAMTGGAANVTRKAVTVGLNGSATLEHVTASTSGPGGQIGMDVGGLSSVRIVDSNLTVESTDGYGSTGIHSRGTLELVGTTIRAKGGYSLGVWNENQASLENVHVESDYAGINNVDEGLAADLSVDHSVVLAGTSQPLFVDHGTAARVGASLLGGPAPVNGLGTKVCVASYDANYAPLDGNCAPIP